MNEYLNPETWENYWRERFDSRQNMYQGESGLGYWEKRADDFSEMRQSLDYEYGRVVYEAIQGQLPEKAEVLDIGAGPGAFLIPFAPHVKRFCALEPAENMIANLERNAAIAGINNYEVVPTTWEDLDPAVHHGKYDLVLISITMWMFRDIANRILAMERLSKDLCCVVTGVGTEASGHSDALWTEMVGDVRQPSYSEFPFIFNMLYAMGRRPEVRMVSHSAERSLNSRVKQQELFYAKYTPLDDIKKQTIREHVQKATEQTGGVSREKYTSAIVFWRV